MKKIKIETANGVYTVKQPIGRLGVQHFTILTKSAPRTTEPDKNGNFVMSPSDEKRYYDGMNEWYDKILKEILIPEESVFPYDEIPGEDTFAIFMAIGSKTKTSDDFFRIVE